MKVRTLFVCGHFYFYSANDRQIVNIFKVSCTLCFGIKTRNTHNHTSRIEYRKKMKNKNERKRSFTYARTHYDYVVSTNSNSMSFWMFTSVGRFGRLFDSFLLHTHTHITLHGIYVVRKINSRKCLQRLNTHSSWKLIETIEMKILTILL